MKIFIVATIIFISYLIFDLIYDQQLWELNTRTTKYLQKYEHSFYQSMFNFVSDWTNIIPQLAILIFIFTDNKLAYILYLCLIQSTISINSVLKNIYHQPRPYWVEYYIKALSCNKEFGKPSGHAMGSLTMSALLPLMLLPSSFSKKHGTIKAILICIISLWTFMTALSRIYLGMHSLGQIILGWVYSSYFILIYICYIHEPIKKYIQIRLSSTGNGLSWQFIGIVGLFTIIWLLTSILLWDINYVFLDQKELNQWLFAIYEKCPNQTEILELSNSQVFYNFCLYKSFEITFIFFIVLGIKLSNGRYEEDKFLANFQQLNWKQKSIRILILLILLMPLKILDFISNENTWVITFAYTIPWNAYSGLILTFGYTKLLKYFQLNIDGDFLNIKFVKNLNLTIEDNFLINDQNSEFSLDS